MENAQNTSPSGPGEATAFRIEDQTKHKRTSSVHTLEPPEGAGQFVAQVGVESVTRLPKS